ncbi:asparagine synthase (glutamine-hydrolyzing) [Candidatus Roizmanbacteria bacterium RIFCSPHIGHO2_12_FULL_39_8]|uniref:asparagine synthase (glutamine-hydrolyzing) n=2 Tax=Candidatus Roizmaniibacteriota TaxID=1752723 RepID=A0A1F7HXA0_9BACT|nr:MAG: asparagine synthase (glutamine-hydrolyzing) [Candidatus Roizmanbacteria bacterium RIFCSPHIGHO2_12_FULL_39_8]
MCGIAGFYGFRNDNLIKKFSKDLEHRGPDGEGLYIEDKVTLLNRRLAIIDRAGGNQPIYNEDKSIAIVFVGEIYNFQQQRKELLRLGHIFTTKSDTEVVIHAYEEWGEKSFDRHNGMFTFALYDKKEKRLLLVRDHFGIKPLYYSVINSNFKSQISNPKFKSQSTESLKLVFSSEIKPIINSGLIKKKPNDRILYRYLKYRIHDDKKETFFEGINRLMPGELLEIRNLRFEVRKYTNLQNELLNSEHSSSRQAKDISKSETDIFKNKLITAIRLRLISEVPVGTCLSGGLDSSTVVTIVNKLLQEKVKEAESVGKVQNTFSAVFPNSRNDEEKYIDEIVKSVKLKVHKVNPKPEEFFKDIEEFIKTQEEPTISTGPYTQYKVMQMAHNKVTVLLDGQGADEMMAGYDPYMFVYLRQLWRQRNISLLVREIISSKDIVFKYVWRKIATILGVKRDVELLRILNSKFQEKFRNETFKTENHNLKRRLIEDIFSNSLQSLLRYEDRNAMRFSLEGRVPFLDFNLVRYLFDLPDEAIIKNGWNKFILRQSIDGIVPDLIRLRRNKIGFTTPEQEWFLRMKNKIYAIFLSESFANRSYFNQQEVLKAFQKFIEGKNDDTMLFWRLLNVEMWLRTFFDKSPKSVKSIRSIKSQFSPNEGKKLEIKVEGKEYLRYPVRTELFKKGDKLAEKITSLLHDQIGNDKSIGKEVGQRDWFIVISEKIVAIAQGRSYFIWDIKPSFFAKLLSKYVRKTPYGIGLGSPWTMQLAIDEVGLPKILLATIVSAVTKPFGVKGLFYKIAGQETASIDGPTEYSLYPSNVSAKLGPKNPEKVVGEIHQEISSKFEYRNPKQIKNLNHEKTTNYKLQTTNFLGIVIIDANDLGQTVLGNSTSLPDAKIAKIFKDNPMGQSDEQTPVVLVFEQK